MGELNFTDEGTVLFMPYRLNRDPIVVRGLTSDEVLLAGVAVRRSVSRLGCCFGLSAGKSLCCQQRFWRSALLSPSSLPARCCAA